MKIFPSVVLNYLKGRKILNLLLLNAYQSKTYLEIELYGHIISIVKPKILKLFITCFINKNDIYIKIILLNSY